MIDCSTLLPAVCAAARHAGALILGVYETSTAPGLRDKGDGSPVTMADLIGERAICQALAALTPNVPIVGEEAHAEGLCPAVGEQFWLVDALDGTREFINRNAEFTVNIGLVDGRNAVLGVVYAPALDVLYAGSLTTGAFLEQGGQRRPIRCRVGSPEGVDVVGSRSHGDATAMEAFLTAHSIRNYIGVGSSLKFCLVAEGRADLYPRLGRTMEWDTAAGHAVLSASGGSVTTLQGEPLHYGKPGYANPPFCAHGLSVPALPGV
jgi:3'(2'), 5'-bisphosphate nucleotidase